MWKVSLLLLLMASSAVQTMQRPYVERVEVGRVLLDVRVLDTDGKPVTGLGAGNFEVIIEGRSARVDSVQWLGTLELPNERNPQDATAVSPGRLVVFLVQKTLERSPLSIQARQITALSRTLHVTDHLLARLTPGDRVAVLSLDSHLRMWTDFTNDFDRVRKHLQKDILTSAPVQLGESRAGAPSLGESLPSERMRSINTVADALRHVADALAPIPGHKTLVFVGYGFGTPDALNRSLEMAATLPGLIDGVEYGKARAALLASRTSVFSLDVTDAQKHALETGLETVATDTGGVFARTNQFPDIALQRVADALDGHYVISAEKPELGAGTHRVSVRLAGRSGRVLAPTTYID